MTFGTRLPLVAAPMAGGGTTPALVAATTAAGAFAFLPAGYKRPEALSGEMAELQAAGVPFGVNLFVPDRTAMDPVAFVEYADALAPEAAAVGVSLAEQAAAGPVTDDDHWAAKLDLLGAAGVPWVSFTFGLPSSQEAEALRAAGSRLLATVTTRAEAEAAMTLGVDGLVVQGSAAGGHSGTFDPRREIVDVDTADLVRDLVPLGLPIVAAGGVGGPERVRELLAAGADGVGVGTLLLRTDEAGTSATHRAALSDPRFTTTTITHSFTGRPARGLANGFIARHEGEAPYGYPAIHHLTRGLRAAAAQAGDPERVHLWAGTGWRSARRGPAADTLAWLAEGV